MDLFQQYFLKEMKFLTEANATTKKCIEAQRHGYIDTGDIRG